MMALTQSLARTTILVGVALILILVLLPAVLVAAGPALFVGSGSTVS
ncbi:MAG: hypothetical protein V4515_04260 [Chloroflexota bacterium]